MEIPEFARVKVNSHMLRKYNASSVCVWIYIGTGGCGESTFVRPYADLAYMVAYMVSVTIYPDNIVSIAVYKAIEELRS
jgi:ABC-type phosphate transport system ATPase subunit